MVKGMHGTFIALSLICCFRELIFKWQVVHRDDFEVIGAFTTAHNNTYFHKICVMQPSLCLQHSDHQE